MNLALDLIVFDEYVYPRSYPDWRTTYRYASEMRAGCVFPPIIVGKRKTERTTTGYEWVLLDGKHRVGAFTILKRRTIPGVISPVKEKDFLLEALRLNSTNARPLTIQDRLMVAERLSTEGRSDREIAKAMNMRLDELKKYQVERVVKSPVTGAVPIVLKAPFRKGKLSGIVDLNNAAEVNLAQESMAATSQLQILDSAIAVFEHNLLDETSETVIKYALDLYEVMTPWVQLYRTRHSS